MVIDKLTILVNNDDYSIIAEGRGCIRKLMQLYSETYAVVFGNLYSETNTVVFGNLYSETNAVAFGNLF